jgi:hypothetical protein
MGNKNHFVCCDAPVDLGHMFGCPNSPENAPTVKSVRRDGNRWRVVVELTWDVLPDDVTEKYEGDAEVDFASRGFARVRGALETLIGYANRGGPRDDTAAFQHYHILELPKRVTEFD